MGSQSARLKPRPESPPPSLLTPEEALACAMNLTPENVLEYAIRQFRFTRRPWPHLPFMHPTLKNLEMLRTLDVLLLSYQKTSMNIADTHSIMFCGAIAACDLAGLKVYRQEEKPAPRAPLCDPWQISEEHLREDLRPITEKQVKMRGKGDKVLCCVHQPFNGTGTTLETFMWRHYSLQESRLKRTKVLKYEVDANLWPIFDVKVRPGSLDLLHAGWGHDLSDSSIWIEVGIFQNGFQSPFWFCPSLNLVHRFMDISGKGRRHLREAEMILHLLPEDASYKLLELEPWVTKKLIVILKVIQYFKAGIEMNFIVDKCAVIHVDIKRSKTRPSFTRKTLRSIGIKETYGLLNIQTPRSLDDQEPVDCKVIYQPEKERSLMLCRTKEINGKQKRAHRARLAKAYGPGGILQEYGPFENMYDI